MRIWILYCCQWKSASAESLPTTSTVLPRQLEEKLDVPLTTLFDFRYTTALYESGYMLYSIQSKYICSNCVGRTDQLVIFFPLLGHFPDPGQKQ